MKSKYIFEKMELDGEFVAVPVGDGAAVRQLTDDVCVTDRSKAICGDHIAVEIHALGFTVVVVLGNGDKAT